VQIKQKTLVGLKSKRFSTVDSTAQSEVRLPTISEIPKPRASDKFSVYEDALGVLKRVQIGKSRSSLLPAFASRSNSVGGTSQGIP
jgi:hypothetical protein